jgi:hypothetical protein
MILTAAFPAYLTGQSWIAWLKRNCKQRRYADPPLRLTYWPWRVAELEKEVFGSVTFSLALVPPLPALWHEANEAISVARMNRAIQFNCFRITNESRTNAGCKPTKSVPRRNLKVAHRSIFGVRWFVWTRT